MPKPGTPTEKANDFGAAIKRLFKHLARWKIPTIIAIILAMAGSIFQLISPNKLSEITDTITEGITPDSGKIQVVMQTIGANMQTNPGKDLVIDGITISPEDQAKTMEIISGLNTLGDVTSGEASEDEQDEMLKKMQELPESVAKSIESKMDFDKIAQLVIFLAVLYIVNVTFGYLQSFILSTVSNKFARSLRNSIAKKINRLPLKYFSDHEMGDILSRVTNDVDMIGHNLNNSLATLVSSITLLIGCVVMMFITNPIMAVVAIVSSMIGIGAMVAILSKSQKYFNEKQKQLGNLNGHIEEIYSGHNIVKAYNGEKNAIAEFKKLNKKLYKSNQMSQFLSGLMPSLMNFIGNLGYVAVCVAGAILIINNTIGFGVIVAFMIYVRLFTNPLSQIAQAMSNLQASAAASERVFEFLDEKEMSDERNLTGKLLPSEAEGDIVFDHVRFNYDPERTVIKDFSFEAKSGQKIAIVGPTGAGKTTLAQLLMKFYEISGGDIILDNHSIHNLTRENVHELFTMVLQDTWLFEGTVRDNIKFNRKNVSDKQIWEALRAVGVEHFVKTLPGGLDAVIDDSDAISQGQKQLLTIARGMIKDSPFLILDEATSNVDTRTEEVVQQAMDKLMHGRTSFVIAHRLSTIKNANTILVINDGNIIEQGNHEQLMKAKGFYADLYNSQFTKAGSFE